MNVEIKLLYRLNCDGNNGSVVYAAHCGAVVGSKMTVNIGGVFRDKTVTNSVVSITFIVNKRYRFKSVNGIKSGNR